MKRAATLPLVATAAAAAVDLTTAANCSLYLFICCRSRNVRSFSKFDAATAAAAAAATAVDADEEDVSEDDNELLLLLIPFGK